MLRCDDIFSDTNIGDCRQIWNLIHKYGFNQVLGVVACGLGGTILHRKPARQGNKWILEQTGDTLVGTNKELVNLINEQLIKGDKLGLHGYYHISYRKEPYEVQMNHIRNGKDYLEHLFNTEVKHFVPPFNGYNENTEKVTASLGMTITYPNPEELDVFLVDENKTRSDIKKLARQDTRKKNYSFYHPFILSGNWEGKRIYIERHDKYMNVSHATWNLEWALSRFEIYLKEMRRYIDEEVTKF